MTNIQEQILESPHSDNWGETLRECHQRPLGTAIQSIQQIVEGLNSKTVQTNYAFYLHQVVDGITPPNVAPYFYNGTEWTQPVKAEVTGPEVQALLDRLPQSVRTGEDEIYEVYQIRLDNYKSLEHMMGTTTLLLFFLMCRDEADLCYFFANDPNSYTNWEILKNMYLKHFPQLEKK